MESAARAWLVFARHVVTLAARREDPDLCPDPPDPRSHSGVFVTLHKFGALRGCMGTLDDSLSLADAIRRAGVCAATQDPRFPPVACAELPDIRIELSILSATRPLHRLDELELGVHGIVVRSGERRGLFLPQVATEHHMDRETFLDRCCTEKAGLPPGAWRDGRAEVLLFTTHVLREE